MGTASVDRVSVFPGRKLGALLNVLYADKHHSRQIQDQCYSEESNVHSQKSQSLAIPQVWGKYMWATQGNKVLALRNTKFTDTAPLKRQLRIPSE